MSKQKKKIIIFAVIFIVATLFIWMQSFVVFEKSVEESNAVLDFFNKIFGSDNIKIIDDYSIRKFAHFFEYFVLEIPTFILIASMFKKRHHKQKMKQFAKICGAVILICLFVAIIDELIQFTNNRHPQIYDVGIDLLGAVLSMAISLSVLIIISKIKGNKKHKVGV